MDIQVTIQTILQILGAVAIVGVGVNWIIKMFSPFTQLKKQVEEQEKKLARDKQALDDIHATLTKLDRRMGITSWAIIEIMNHEISGNDVNKLEKRRDDLMKDLTGKQLEEEDG